MIKWFYKTFGHVTTCSDCHKNFVMIRYEDYPECDECRDDRLVRYADRSKDSKLKVEKLVDQGRY